MASWPWRYIERRGLLHRDPSGPALTPPRHPHQHSTFMVVRPKARHNHPMTVTGFVTADGLTLEHGRFDVRLDKLRTVHEATLSVALER